MAISTVRAYSLNDSGEEPEVLENEHILIGRVKIYSIENSGVIVLDEKETKWYVTYEDWWHYNHTADSF
jgi:hypothetical protein